jgi:RNA polymerase sigma-70 factor (ECF subfamily)
VDPKLFTAVDRELLKRCLNKEPGSWNDFVDRYLSLIYHVIGYTAHLRSVRLGPEDVEDLAAEVLLKIVSNNFKVLREFRGESSFATYLTVVARRLCVQELVRRQQRKEAIARGEVRVPAAELDEEPAAQKGVESLEEVEKLLKRLSGRERDIVRLYYLEARTYEEISTETDVPVNTIGTILSRARKKLREKAAKAAARAAKRGGMDSLGLAVKASAPPPPSTIILPPPSPPPPPAPKSSVLRPVKPTKPSKPHKDQKNGE